MAVKKKNQVENRFEFWRQHMAACLRSGLSYAEYCRRNDLTESTFGYWRRRISTVNNGQSGFVELRVTPDTDSGIEVVLRNRVRLTIVADFDESVLNKLVRVLESV